MRQCYSPATICQPLNTKLSAKALFSNDLRVNQLRSSVGLRKLQPEIIGFDAVFRRFCGACFLHGNERWPGRVGTRICQIAFAVFYVPRALAFVGPESKV